MKGFAGKTWKFGGKTEEKIARSDGKRRFEEI